MKRTPWIGGAFAVCALALLLPRAAHAQEGPSSQKPLGGSSFTPGQQQEAEDRWKEGRALYEDGKVDEARLKYAQAFAVLQRTNILWNLAIAEFYSGRPLESLRHFKQFVQRPDADAADVKRANEKYIPEAAQQTGHLIVEAAPGLEIVVDEDVMPGATPFRDTVDVAPGTHRVYARYRGKTEAKQVTCVPGKDVVVHFDMQTAEPGKRELVPVYPKARTFLTVGLGVAAIAATSVGAVFALDSSSRDDENRAFVGQNPQGVCVDRGSSGCVAWQERLDSQQTSSTLAKVFYVTGGVLAAGAIVTWFAWPKPKTEAPKSSAWIAPGVAPGGAALHFGGTF